MNKAEITELGGDMHSRGSRASKIHEGCTVKMVDGEDCRGRGGCNNINSKSDVWRGV